MRLRSLAQKRGARPYPPGRVRSARRRILRPLTALPAHCRRASRVAVNPTLNCRNQRMLGPFELGLEHRAMSKGDELRHGAPGETAVHLCVDMQRSAGRHEPGITPRANPPAHENGHRPARNTGALRRTPAGIDGQVRWRDKLRRAPGQGLWDSGGDVERDNIAVIEVMTLVRESLATAPR
jgi:hypothetical protein